MEGIRFGTADEDAWALDETPGILSSGAACIGIPYKFYKWVLMQLRQKGLNFSQDENGDIKIDSCKNISEALDLYVLYGGYWFLIKASDYIST